MDFDTFCFIYDAVKAARFYQTFGGKVGPTWLIIHQSTSISPSLFDVECRKRGLPYP